MTAADDQPESTDPDVPPTPPKGARRAGAGEARSRSSGGLGRLTGAHEVDRLEDRGPAAYAAELVGTLLLVFFITAAVSLYVEAPDPQTGVQPFIDFTVIGLVHVFALFALIQVFGVVSGAHFNPAVTAALVLARRVTPKDGAAHVVAQLVGATAGAFLTKALLVDEGATENYGATVVSDRLGGEILSGMAVEGIGTFFLLLVIFGTAVNPEGAREWAGLAIGGALGMLVMVLAPLTGAGFNPARSFGPALAGEAFDGADKFILVYVVAPIIGGLLAATVYGSILRAPGQRESGEREVG